MCPDPVQDHVAARHRRHAGPFYEQSIGEFGAAQFEHRAGVIAVLATNAKVLLADIQVFDLTVNLHLHAGLEGSRDAQHVGRLDSVLATVLTADLDNVPRGQGVERVTFGHREPVHQDSSTQHDKGPGRSVDARNRPDQVRGKANFAGPRRARLGIDSAPDGHHHADV